jgi:peptidoglycan/xylan/chitin deacetylase (PgdA/CDA1 family)
MMLTKAKLREAFAQIVIATGIARMTRAMLWRDRVAILLYHDPEAETLDRHLAYLKTICDVVSLEQLSLPGTGRPRAVVTLDDGHARNMDLLPVFIKHKVRPTIFLCSSIVGRPCSHWWLHPGARQAGVERLKQQTNAQRLTELEAHGCRQDGTHQASGLSLEQLEAMRPFVDFQSHTRFHPVLTRCDDAECEEEIAVSKHEIEALTGSNCEHFAYPNGHYSAREVDMLKAAGYKTARTCDAGWNDRSSDPFRLRAFEIDDDSSLRWFAAQLTGIPLFLRHLRSGGGWAGRQHQF